MKYVLVVFGILLALSACEIKQDSKLVSENPFYRYFYPYDTIPKVYVYRNVAQGLEEEFHRIFSIEDSQGKHTVVELYAEDGRLLEAMNYNIDSLDVIDHMVVDKNQKKQKALVTEDQLIPLSKLQKGVFASNFPGVLDSTFFLKYIERSFVKSGEMDVLDRESKTVTFKDEILLKLYNPWKKLEDPREGVAFYVFAEGYGLVEWYSEDKSVHYKLEKIISQSDFVKLMSR